MLKVYLVGGAVRDQLLRRPVKERDWVVVGATPKQMLSLGYRQVGRDFPVFLHPKSHEEYALARTERKTGKGYTQFITHSSSDVTLEDDLKRRDLTINAIAQAEDGTLIDPCNGQRDLQQRILRHVSPAFVEDPVRILRIARLAARFANLGFHVAPETMLLMQQMVQAGEVDALVAERVWQEMATALQEPQPQVFFAVLRECGALALLFPEIDQLFGVPNPADVHPEIDSGIHTLMVLEQAARLTSDPMVRFAALLHDVGKGLTPQQFWPKHPDHEEKGVPLVERLCVRYRAPRDYQDLAVLTCRYHGHCHRAFELTAAEILTLLEAVDAVRRPERFAQFLLACEADSRGRTGYEDETYPQRPWLQAIFEVVKAVAVQPFMAQGLQGKQLGEALQQQRLHAIEAYIRKHRGTTS